MWERQASNNDKRTNVLGKLLIRSVESYGRANNSTMNFTEEILKLEEIKMLDLIFKRNDCFV